MTKRDSTDRNSTDRNSTSRDSTGAQPSNVGESGSVAVISAAVVREHLGDRVQFDYPVADLTTYRVGGRAHSFFVAQSVADLRALSVLQRETGLDVVVIGRGSNVLFADTGFAGMVVQLGAFATNLDIPEFESVGVDVHQDTPVHVRAGGSVPLPVAARQTAAAGLQGFEWAVGVPGTIGGGIRMNAGGHGSDMARTLLNADIFDLTCGELKTLPASDIGLRFRGSDLSDSDIVTGATLILQHGSRDVAIKLIDDVVRWRRAHQPGGQNAGSVFVNPVPTKLSAGELIDRCGKRGFRVGSAHVSDKHANFIQSDPQGTASDVVAVMRAVRTAVAEQTGYQLRSEVKLLGFSVEVAAEFSTAETPSSDSESDS